MSNLSTIFDVVKDGLKDIGADASHTLLGMGEEAGEEAEQAIREYHAIIEPVITTYANYPKEAHELMHTGQLGLASRLAGIANEKARTTFSTILSDSLKSLTTLLGEAVKVFG